MLSVIEMLRAMTMFACLLIAGSASPQVPAKASPQPVIVDASNLSESVRDVLARVRPSIVQIKGFFGSNTANNFHGTGFAVAPGGVFMTNYHVVAELIMHPDKYRLEYHTPEGKTGKVEVLAVDVRHDLAVVRAEHFAPAPLPIDPTVPAKGSRAYAVGFPLDVGLTITEGISNGRVEDAFYARIHYSGALNGGMSGGPALSARGTVTGVNVAGYRFEQLVAFLVPASHLSPLIEQALTKPADLRELKKSVTAQLRAHADELLGAFAGAMPTQVTAGYALPAKLAPFVDCKASGDPAADAPVQQVTIQCAAKAGLYVQQGLFTGDIRYAHYILSTDKLDTWRFANRLSGLARATGAFGRPKHVGPFDCETNVVKLRRFDASLMVCVRSYRGLEGLYDITVRALSLNESKRGMASHLDMHGVDFTGGMQFVKRFVEAMEWQE
ncbi:MAG: serine protease [Betaproteobacteria bacterium]|nr:serine protease [Betaproteobacteria bacterium]